MKMNQFYKLALIFTGLSFVNVALSQDYNFAVKGEYEMPGFGNARAYDDQGIEEIVDPFTGSLKLVVRDLHLPGNGGLDISVLRFYNSLQSPYNPQSALYNQPNPPGTMLTGRSVVGLGWDLHFGRVWTHLGNAIPASNTPTACKIQNVSSQWNPVLELPDGTRKLLVNDEGTSTSNSYSLTSGDFWKAKCLPPSAESAVGRGGLIVTSPDGITYTFNVRGLPVGVGNGTDTKNPYLVTKIEDRNGNALNITYKNTWPTPGSVARHVLVDKITSSDGRTVSFTYNDETTLNATLKSISAHGQNVSYNYQTVSSDTVNSYLGSVNRPDNSTVSYNYYNTSSDAGTIGAGSLKKVGNPYGLNTEYTYKQVQFGLDATKKSWVIATKKTSGTNITTGNWSYDYAPTSTSDKTTVVSNDNCIIYEHVGDKALPTGSNLNLNLWKAGILLSKEIRSKSSSTCGSSIFQREQYDWVSLRVSDHNDFRRRLSGGDAYALSTETYAPRLAKVTTTRNSTNYVTEYNQPDTYGNARQIIEWHGSDLSKVTNITYKATNSFSAWLPNVVSTKNITGIAGEVSYIYDTKGNVEQENNYGLVTSYTYHTSGDLKSMTKPENQIFNYSNYYRGIARKEDQPEGVTYLRTVDDRGNVTCQNISTFNEASSYTCATISAGIKTSYSYDTMNRLTDVITPLTTDNNVTISYNHSGGSYKSTITRGGLITTTQFHPYGGIRKKDITADGTTYSLNFNYDPSGKKIFASYPNSTTLGERFEFDELDRLDKVVHTVDNSFVDYVYLADNKVRILDEKNNQTTYEYRSFGHPDNKWLTKIIAPESQTTEIVRLNSGLIDYVTQGGYTHDYGYNGYWQLTSETRPETGTTTYGRDLAGNVISRQIGASPVTYFYYDKLNRLKNIDYPNSTLDVNYNYDVRGNILGVSSLDSLVSPTNSSSRANSVSYSYDLNGNLKSESISNGYMKYSYVLEHTYNQNDALSTVKYTPVYPMGAYPSISTLVDYAPNGLGRPTKVGNYASNITYHPNGQLYSITYGNGRKTTITQSNRLLPKRLSVTNSVNSTLIDMDYSYDLAGNLELMTAPDPLSSQSWTYDALNRLKTETRYPANTAIIYDPVGNITSKSKGTQSLTYNYDFSRNRLSSISGAYNYSFGYDIYGNVTANGRNTFEYDDALNMVSLKSTSGVLLKKHIYDGNNRRVSVHNSNQAVEKYYVYNSAGNVMHESNLTGTLTNNVYIYLGNQLIATESTCITCGSSTPTVTYYNNDIMGSPIQASTQNGSLLWDAKYDPYGEKHSQAQNSLGYTGHVLDTGTGLTYMQGRYYDGLLGRFMGVDSIGFSESNPMSFNRYSYGNNNPYKYTDPDGRMSIRVNKVIGNGLNTSFHLQTDTFKEYSNLAVDYVGNPARKIKWLDRLMTGGELTEAVVDAIPDPAGPLDSAKLSDVIELDKKLAPYFSALQEKKSKGLMVTPEEFGAALKNSIIEEGRKAGSNPVDGNPVRDKFRALYGTDEDGFVQRAVDNYNKTNQPTIN